MEKLEQLYEGKAKRVFKTSEPETYWIEYKDDATAFNGEKKAQIAGKGTLNNEISSIFLSLLKEKGVDNHFIKKISATEQIVQQVEIIPIEVVVRNIAAGSLAKRLGWDEGKELPKMIVEFYYKNDELGDPMINNDHIDILGLAAEQELVEIRKQALKINEILKEFLQTKNIILVDFKLEFGKTPAGTIILADEISPDTCRFWDADTMKKLDKDRFRRDLGSVEEAYQEILRRIGGSVNV
ncbi:phosphoribosylaminoimidazolesuccinocarboxamide synthase [Bacillus sp. AFS076308]|uniref:phosphoribosylaminoimidazolesuccinocarboxamide synthase n=1 Tax=unclassified Bacillus (in: firmicutes) TaxID=185979 RepID=UPI000BF2F525|nr:MULTISPECIES: phosphoribosylaminoimidazolesuccinocarboxamide synthase [unclassified Bacillus (in: firmicutes)]PFN98079.1 phosphoribosylaminoimidazolesuccinocarboxamide synthase [Bacillus sp. AFS076308]PGV50794.1 phosphoribosylaminoimidazolesuccinocarboxamide synthase [Bacillus sp. AFS037270]